VPFIYVLQCGDGSLYTGATTELNRRLNEHHAGKASHYTRSRLPVVLVWSAEVATWSEALSEERRIKSLSRAAKKRLVATTD
jgi:predicted GIY-YIG superfamily endonuclease